MSGHRSTPPNDIECVTVVIVLVYAIAVATGINIGGTLVVPVRVVNAQKLVLGTLVTVESFPLLSGDDIINKFKQKLN